MRNGGWYCVNDVSSERFFVVDSLFRRDPKSQLWTNCWVRKITCKDYTMLTWLVNFVIGLLRWIIITYLIKPFVDYVIIDPLPDVLRGVLLWTSWLVLSRALSTTLLKAQLTQVWKLLTMLWLLGLPSYYWDCLCIYLFIMCILLPWVFCVAL